MTVATLNCILIGIIFVKGLRSGVKSVFHFLAAMMVVVFYMVPSFSFYEIGEYIYLGHKWDFTTSDFVFTQSCLFVFLCGFLFLDLILVNKSYAVLLNEVKQDIDHFAFNKFTIFLLFVPAAFLIGAFVLFSDSADIMIGMRRGEITTSPLFGIMLTTATLFIAALFFIAEERRMSVLAVFLMPILILSVATFGGRMAFAGVLALCLGYFRAPLRLMVFVVIVASPLLIPLAANGKAIVYAVVGGFEWREILTFLSLEVDMRAFVENNLGHPVVSVNNLDGIIDILGYRYFYDYLHGFLFYLRLLGISVDGSLTYYNTFVLTGEFRSQIPTGFLAFGYVQASYIGVFVSGVFYRFLGWLAVSCYLKIGLRSSLFGFYLALLAANSFYTGEVRTLVVNLFYPLVFFRVIFWATRLH